MEEISIESTLEMFLQHNYRLWNPNKYRFGVNIFEREKDVCLVEIKLYTNDEKIEICRIIGKFFKKQLYFQLKIPKKLGKEVRFT